MYTKITRYKPHWYKCEPNTFIFLSGDKWVIMQNGRTVFRADTLRECKEFIYRSDRWKGEKYSW